MKIKYFSLLFLCLLLLYACSKDQDLQVDTPSFNVAGYTVEDIIDTLGNPVKQVTFNMEGNADVISFYSGEIFHEYAYKDGHILPTDALNMSFEYFAALGTGTVIRENQLSVQISTDFNGEMTDEGIGSASWTDITERFSLQQVKDITERTATSADISDLTDVGTPFYIAFKYVTPPQTTTERYSTWDLFSFSVSQETALGSTLLFSQSDSPVPLYFKGPNDADDPGRSARSVSNSSRIRFRGNILAKNLPLHAEVWAITPPLVKGDDIDLGPDRPASIKSRIDPVLTAFTYNYTEPGTYKVAFIASNVTTKGEKKIVKELEIVVP